MLPREQETLLGAFLERVRAIYGNDLVSAILYGSAAGGELPDRHSNINLLVVLADTGLPTLAKVSGLVGSRRFRAIAPVFFTEAYMRNSADVFPIEFLDMKENYAVLYGKDVLKDLAVDLKNLRFQCEQELKSKLIQIKRQYITAKGKGDLERLLFRNFTSAVHILRNLLRLKGQTPPYQKNIILSDVERSFAVKTTVMNEVLWAKTKNMPLTEKDLDGLLIGFVGELESVTGIVDMM